MIKNAVLPIALFLCGVCAVPLTASAQISVSRSVVEFSRTEKVQDVEVYNGGDHKVYLDMTAAEIINPESENAQRVELTDPRSAPLLVTPRQLLVPAGERRRLRIVLREQAVEKDRVFRLAVKPYSGSVNIDGAGDDKKSSAIKVLVGYDLLLVSRPPQLNADVAVNRTARSIEFRNTGNTNVLLRKIEQCDDQGEQCVELPPNRLYAGESYTLDLPLPGKATQYPVTVWQAVGLQNSKKVY
ncbi:MAG: molecular chaperone [Granulosicoccus sp.]